MALFTDPYHEIFKRKLIKLVDQERIPKIKVIVKDLGRNRDYINDLTSGNKYPSFKMFYKLCRYFDVSPKYFFDDNDTTPLVVTKMLNNLLLLLRYAPAEFEKLNDYIAERVKSLKEIEQKELEAKENEAENQNRNQSNDKQDQ